MTSTETTHNDTTRKAEQAASKTADAARDTMAKAGNGARETIAAATDNAHETLSAVHTSVAKAMDRNRAIVNHLLRAMQEESLRFLNMRFEHTSRALERTREVQGISGLITLQQDYLMDAARDCAEFNKRFGEVFREVTEHGADNLHDLAQDTAEVQKRQANGGRAAA